MKKNIEDGSSVGNSIQRGQNSHSETLVFKFYEIPIPVFFPEIPGIVIRNFRDLIESSINPFTRMEMEILIFLDE